MADALRQRALGWLAQREHSRHELRLRLLRSLARSARRTAAGAEAQAFADADGDVDSDPETEGLGHAEAADKAGAAAQAASRVEATLDWLAERGYLSDERFVASRLHQRSPAWGERRIAQELKSHGLGLAGDARDELRRTEFERAQQLWLRRYGQAPTDAKEALRQMRFLAARGFAPEVIRRLVRARPGSSRDWPEEPADPELHDPSDTDAEVGLDTGHGPGLGAA